MARPEGTPSQLRWPGLPARIAIGFGAALVSLAAASGASYVALSARDSASALVRHTAEAQHAIEELESALLVSDVALRAHVEDHDPRHRDLFQSGWSKVLPALADLQRISEAHPEQKPRIARIAEAVDEIRAEQARLVALVDAGDLPGARALETANAAREVLEGAMTMLGRIDEDEQRAHEGREAAWKRTVLVSNAVFVAAVGVLLVLILLAARLVRDDIRTREAARADRERTLVVQRRLMAVVSHDLRNPLGAILTAAWALARLELPPNAGAMVRRIVSSGRRMERLIRDLLDWSRLQAGGSVPIATREADLFDACQRITDELRDRDGKLIHLERDGDTRATFDPERIEQVVGNLLSNALRYAPPGTTVLVRAVGTPQEVRLEVHDEGPGIPSEAQARIFEPFRQGPSGHGTGLGLGLFIVRSVAEAHGGRVHLESAPGKTSFVVHLPRCVAALGGEGGATR
ncbi:ATP-binding protein [Anaeromyxobacter sp. Fw109-5]|uniref:sensor histidine kinase n=1 Tax=Anaeromyxobacter sp. (strain Fw109-5) TaxID=404589 RepID=UPI0000ED81F7|nr:ATP-binding protein [Anaeromyxobacter sp. Fw109-5]ABS26073.1 histidine kinase [Anaeromyxobacter sp. Fw109-5]